MVETGVTGSSRRSTDGLGRGFEGRPWRFR